MTPLVLHLLGCASGSAPASDVSEGWCGRRRWHGTMLMETQNRDGRYIYKFSENPREDLGEINENIKSTYLWEVTFFPPPPPFLLFPVSLQSVNTLLFSSRKYKVSQHIWKPSPGPERNKRGLHFLKIAISCCCLIISLLEIGLRRRLSWVLSLQVPSCPVPHTPSFLLPEAITPTCYSSMATATVPSTSGWFFLCLCLYHPIIKVL